MPGKKKKQTDANEPDGAFLLKVVMYMILASFWLKFPEPVEFFYVGLYGVPVGLFIGLAVASRDRFQIDRKIEYVVLIVMTVVTFFLPSGILL